MAKFSKVSINLSELNEVGGIQRFTTTANNGKQYFNFTMVEKKNVGEYGDTHFLKVSWKEGNKWSEKIVGSVKPMGTQHNPESPKRDNLPF